MHMAKEVHPRYRRPYAAVLRSSNKLTAGIPFVMIGTKQGGSACRRSRRGGDGCCGTRFSHEANEPPTTVRSLDRRVPAYRGRAERKKEVLTTRRAAARE